MAAEQMATLRGAFGHFDSFTWDGGLTPNIPWTQTTICQPENIMKPLKNMVAEQIATLRGAFGHFDSIKQHEFESHNLPLTSETSLDP